MSGASQEFIKTFRADLAALCCAGAYVSQPHIWDSFAEWIKEFQPDRDLPVARDDLMERMMTSVLRTDRVIMMSELLAGLPDQEIRNFLEGEK